MLWKISQDRQKKIRQKKGGGEGVNMCKEDHVGRVCPANLEIHLNNPKLTAK
jgi:hypothetical protein